MDPVRYLGNHSSGKMGFSIAKAALSKGYAVDLIVGPTKQELIHPNLRRFDVVSANDMLQKVQELWGESNYGIFSAAVADYRPAVSSEIKIKKNEGEMNLSLLKNPDILSWASNNRNNQQKVIGFALETNNEEENALSKLERKNLDMIVLNSTQDEEATFGGDLNKVTIFDKNGKKTELPLQSKLNIGIELINIISTFND